MPADQVSTHAAPARRRTTVTRQQLIEQGRSGRPWAFLPAVLQALRVAPDDEALRFLAAANFARLGLATPARDLLAELGPQTAGAPDVVALSAAIDKLPRDTLTPDRLIATCRGNIEALAGRGIDLSAELEAWSRQLESWTWFRAHDGNVVRRLGDGREPSDWVGLSDQVAEAERFAREHLVSDTEILFRPPCVLEGVAPPWMLRRLVEITAETSLGYRPRIRVLQADSLELLDGLAQADLRSTIEDPRVSFFTGPDAPEQFRADLHACFHAQIVGPYIRLPTIRTPVQPAASEIIGNAQTAQQSVAQRLDATVRKIYAGRDRAWWAARYAAARDGSDGPIRVLIPTTRHSTYVRHASHDLAKAFSEIGCRAEVFIEADDYTKSTSIAYQRHLEQLRPDLVVLINYGRANTGEMLPAPLPVVCWIQDAMWQQFDAEVGARQTEMDFLAGHLFHELSDRFGYPRRNRLSMPVVVSPRKFHRGPVDPALLERHACEIAYVSHQSETPEAQRDRLLAELAPTPVHQECVEAMYPKLREIAAGPMQRATGKWLAEVVNDTLREVTGDADPHAAARLLKLWAQPMADRLMRHESLRWVADVARRRGWRFRIYGRGWHDHPDLAEHACGELDHGEDLRASYRAAAVHLHVTINTNRHQRVLECVLSGGLPVCRRKAEDIWPPRDYTLKRLAREREPAVCHVPSRKLGYRVVDHPEAMALVALYQRYGRDTGPFHYTTADQIAARRAGDGADLDRDDAWLLGDSAQITFATPQELEQLVERAVERPVWRDNISEAIARRARERYTTDRFAQRIIDLVRSSFE
ncbi:MAG: CgeB family protein [Planctomycetota bacterium]|jgi:hypothetical protein